MDYILTTRIVSEYREMPGLHLTPYQAARLWNVEPRACAVLLDRLVAEGHLRRTAQGKYALADTMTSSRPC